MRRLTNLLGFSLFGFSLIFCATLHSQELVTWSDLRGVQVENDSLLRQKHRDGYASSQAFTADELRSDSNGYFQLTVNDERYTKVIGFIKKSELKTQPITTAHKIIYGVTFNNYNNTYDYREGSNSGELIGSTDDTGDTLKIERIEDTVYYYENGTLLREVTVTIDDDWVIAVLFDDQDGSSQGNSIENVKSNFGVKRLYSQADVTHDNNLDSLGGIDVTALGGIGTYSYSWSNGETTQDIDSLSIGSYVDSIFDDTDTVVKTYYIWQKQNVEWASSIGVIFNGDSSRITSKCAGNTWGESRAVSANFLDTLLDGEIEYVIEDAISNRALGWVPEDVNLDDADINDILFGWYFTTGYDIWGRESGSINLVCDGYLYNVGDTLKLTRIDTVITYYLNGVPMRQTTCDPGERWKVAAFFKNTQENEYFEDVVVSFHDKFLYSSHTTTQIDGVNATGAVDLTVGGGVPPYTYNWSNTATTQDISGLSEGTYSVIVYDADSSFILYDTILVWSRDTVSWVHYKGVFLEGTYDNQIRCPFQLNDWSYSTARTSNYLDTNENGEFYFKVEDALTIRSIGFVPESAGLESGINDQIYSLYTYSTKRVYDRELGTNKQIYRDLVANQVLRIRRVDSVLSFYVDDDLMRRVIVHPTERWYVAANFFGKYANEYYKNVYCTFENESLYADYQATDITTVQGTGSASVTAYGGAPTYGYLWSTGDTTATVDSLSVGLHHVSIFDTNSDTVHYSIPIHEIEYATWDSIINVTVGGTDDEILYSGSSISDPIDAQGRSIQELEQNEDGEFEFTVYGQGYNYFLGFVEDSTTLPVASSKWAAAFEARGGNDLRYFSDTEGSWKRITLDNPANGDVYKIARYDSVVYFFLNDELMVKKTVQPNGKWLVVGAFDDTGANDELKNVNVSFVNPTGKFYKKKSYARLRKKLDGGHFLVQDGTLRFQYDEQYVDQDNDLTYYIYNDYNELITAVSAVAVDPDYGDNRIDIDLSCDGVGLNSGFYTLEVVNEKNEKLYLRFRNEKNYICTEAPGTIPPK